MLKNADQAIIFSETAEVRRGNVQKRRYIFERKELE